MLKQWHADKKPIRCQIVTRRFSVAFTAITFSVSDTLLVMTSEDLKSELNVPLSDDLEFGFGDSNKLPNNPTRYGLALVILLEPVPDFGHPDLIALSEFNSEAETA